VQRVRRGKNTHQATTQAANEKSAPTHSDVNAFCGTSLPTIAHATTFSPKPSRVSINASMV